jgi:hypothetical protein
MEKSRREFLRKFDTIGDRFEFFYDEANSIFLVLDTVLNAKTILDVKIRNYKEYRAVSKLEQIRYIYPKPNNIGKERYQKSVSEIMFSLYGHYSGNSLSPLRLNEVDCVKILLDKYQELGYLTPYSDMIYSEDAVLRKVHTFIRNNGGSAKFIELTKKLNINHTVYYKDDKDVFFKSSYEFIFFSILHFNKIRYEYESFKINQFVPDFYIPEKKILIEILGLTTRAEYNKIVQKKQKLYLSQGYKYQPIEVDRHHPKESILGFCKEIFGSIKTPNFHKYYRKYLVTSEDFIKQLQFYLTEVNEGRLLVSVKKNKSGFRERHRKYYDFAIDNYQTIQLAIKDLVGIPSTKFSATKTSLYWRNIQFTKEELEFVFRNEKRIPTKWESRTTFNKKYNLWSFYKFWGEDSVKKGGEFFGYIETLKERYGYKDLLLEGKIAKEREVEKIALLVYSGKLPINGENSLFSKYRPVYNHLSKNYGGVFYYIKERIGYPPPHILRPKGYYKSEENVNYELEENWKKYRRILGDAERIRKKDESTYYNMIHIIGIKEFKKMWQIFRFDRKLD